MIECQEGEEVPDNMEHLGPAELTSEENHLSIISSFPMASFSEHNKHSPIFAKKVEKGAE